MYRWLWPSRRAAVFDAGLALGVASVEVWIAAAVWRLDSPYGWAVLAFEVLADLALVARRRSPWLAAGLLTVAALVELTSALVAPGSLWPVMADRIWVVTPFGTPFAVYALVVYGAVPARRWLDWTVIGLLALLATRPWRPYPGVISLGLMMTALPAAIGLYAGARRRLFVALAERAERAEREQHLLSAQARADERARLAREMHDVVTHRVSLMVLQAGALRITATDHATRRAAEELRAAGCQALDELRDLVGVLRTGPPPQAAVADDPVSLPDLSALVGKSTGAGVPVELMEVGNPLLTSPAVGRTAYRIVQEALTNVHKHAPGARVRVNVRYGADRVHLTVRNTAPADRPNPGTGLAATGSGTGLLGLRQRVELVSGTFDAGPAPDGGFHVEAMLPAYVPTRGAT